MDEFSIREELEQGQAVARLFLAQVERIAALETENARFKADRAEYLAAPCVCLWQERAEKAEAENAKLRERVVGDAAARIRELEAERDALRRYANNLEHLANSRLVSQSDTL